MSNTMSEHATVEELRAEVARLNGELEGKDKKLREARKNAVMGFFRVLELQARLNIAENILEMIMDAFCKDCEDEDESKAEAGDVPIEEVDLDALFDMIRHSLDQRAQHGGSESDA